MTASLKPCPACGREVSTAAVSCPHCGQPLRTTPGKKYEVIGAGMVILGLIFFFVSSADGNAPLAVVCGVAFFIGLVVFIVGRFK